jgi:hypothetical protein
LTGTDNSYQRDFGRSFLVSGEQNDSCREKRNGRYGMVLDKYSHLKEELVGCINSILIIEGIAAGICEELREKIDNNERSQGKTGSDTEEGFSISE